MDCKSVQLLLDAYRTGELAQGDRRSVRIHVGRCPKCAKLLEESSEISEHAVTLKINAPVSLLGNLHALTGDQYGVVETVLGRIWLGFNQNGITMVDLRSPDKAAFEQGYVDRLGRYCRPGSVPARFTRAIESAARGERLTKVSFSISGLPEFERNVLTHLTGIPRGEVRSYAWLAREAGSPGAVRAVGTVMAKNPIPLLLPCHRVTPSIGGVGQYGYGESMKRELLEREGVSTIELEANARQKIKYIGSRTTGIYCFPTCRDARRISWENRLSFRNEKAASEAGYRPCKHCRPLVA
jgi:O-6-methylguanine DNA methyltransferase